MIQMLITWAFIRYTAIYFVIKGGKKKQNKTERLCLWSYSNRDGMKNKHVYSNENPWANVWYYNLKYRFQEKTMNGVFTGVFSKGSIGDQWGLCIGGEEGGRNARSKEQCKHRRTGVSEGGAGQAEEEGRKGRGEGGCLLEVCWKCASVWRYFCEVFKNNKSSWIKRKEQSIWETKSKAQNWLPLRAHYAWLRISLGRFMGACPDPPIELSREPTLLPQVWRWSPLVLGC